MVIFFYIALFLYISTLSILTKEVDFDFWARLIVGKTFFQTGSLMNFDFQSFGPTRQWFDHEWGSSLIFYTILDKFGEIGLFVFKILILFATYFILTRVILLRRKQKSPNVENPLTTAPFNIIFFMLLIQTSLSIAFATLRCQLFTFLFFAIWLYVLEKARLEKTYKILWILPATMLVWSNIHGGCFTGLGLLALYIFGEFLNKKPIKPFVIALFVSLAVMFINPYGIKYVYFLFHAITLSRPNITEWQPLFSKIHLFKFFKFKLWALAMVLIGTYYLVKKYLHTDGVDFKARITNLYKNLDKTKVLVLIVMFILSLKTLRLLTFFAFCACVFMYDDIYTKIFNKKMPNVLNNLKELLLYFLILVSFFFFFRMTKVETTIKTYPYVEAEFLKINNLKGNLFANFHFGSFLAYKLYPNNFIFMDGRYEETYNPKQLDRMSIIYVGQNWKEEFYRQHIDYAIIEKSCDILFTRLMADKNWRLVLTSNNFGLFIRNDIKLDNPKIPTSDYEYYKKHKWETNIDWK